MYLSKLELIGFKSFAQKTNLKFTPGITAVVGPNGCGKTNIVDAVRWVLGEQKSATLRSEIMENVIFNGTADRKPLGMAEVSMTMKNNRGVLPTEYGEVNITRRLFRDGESQYLLNNVQCRLKDIVDLFMDTGIGSDTYSVIELKMIEAILSGKPEERRHLLEEAAGVTKYKIRRKEATKKLSAIQGDLLRVQDIVAEVEKNVGSLSRQAAKTRRYNKLTEQLKELDVLLLKHDYVTASKELHRFSDNLFHLNNEKSLKEKDIDESEIYLTGLEKKLYEIDAEFKKAIDGESSISSGIAIKNREFAVSEEKLSSININQDRISEELRSSNETINRLSYGIQSSSDKILILKEQKEDYESKLSEIKTELTSKNSVVTSAREDVNIANENLLNNQNRLNFLRSSIEKNRQKREALSERLALDSEEIDKIAKQNLESHNEINSLTGKADILKSEASALESAINDEQSKIERLKNDSDSVRQVISTLKIDLSAKNASLGFLKSILDNNETTKHLIKSSFWRPNSEKITLAEAVGADDEFRVAVEAALGEYSHAFIVESDADAFGAIEVLVNDDKGKASFLIKSKVPDLPGLPALDKSEGIFGWLADLVRADKVIKNALKALFGKTVLVKDKETAFMLTSAAIADFAVTLKGEVISAAGIIRGGSVTKTEGLLVGKKERIELLESEILNLKKSIEENESRLDEISKQLSSNKLNDLNRELKDKNLKIAETGRLISQLTFKAESLLKNISIIEQNQARYHEEIAQLDNEITRYSAEENELNRANLVAKEELQLYLNNLSAAEKELNASRDKARETELGYVKISSELTNLEREIDNFSSQKNQLVTKIQALNNEFKSNQVSAANLQERLKQLNAELLVLQDELKNATLEKNRIAQLKSEIEEQISQYTADLSHKRKTFEKFLESIHQLDLQTSDIKSKTKSVAERAMEKYELDLGAEEIVFESGFSYPETKAAISDIKERLAALGNVNFMALEEYESQSQRLDFYNAQVKDLTDSEKTLQETIEEINQTAEQKFKETFEQVDQNFRFLFKKLFSDQGECELKLIGDNLLESDIEIMAKPPGKKPHTIELLSGGEKTLTSIALLFGIYMVKPSPFCILDEVDAPLDDANIDKFINMIREFSTNTQFLVVTHNKRTMEFADTLYGVTQQEEGVSKVVSVRLSQTLLNETIEG